MSIAPPTAAADLSVGIASDIGEVAKLGAAGINLGAQVDKEMNTPAMVDAGIEAHAQAARDRVERAIAEGDIAYLRKVCQP